MEVVHGVPDSVSPGDLLDQAEPSSGLCEGYQFWKLSDVSEDVVAGLDSIRSDLEACELHFLLAELELLLNKGDAIVTIQFEVVKGVEEIAGDIVVIEEHVVHYLALVETETENRNSLFQQVKLIIVLQIDLYIQV